jgi:heavy metal sensor kinase
VYCAALLMVMAALAAGLYASVRAAVHTIVDHELDSRLAGLDDHLTRHIGRLSWPELRESLESHSAFQPDLLRIADSGGAPLFEGHGFRHVSELAYGDTPARATRRHGGQHLRVLSVRRAIQGRPYDLTLGTDLLIPGAILDQSWLVLLLSIPAVLLAAFWAGYWISGRALAPVSGIIAAAASIDSTRLRQRIAVPDTGDEIQQLATTTNGMLDRIEDGFRHVRQFTADASHELRTPVAIIRAAAEISLLNPSPSERIYREALQRILREAEQSSRLLDDLLYLARADSGSEDVEQAPIDLATSVASACAQVTILAEAKGVAVTFHSERSSGWVVGDADQLRRLWLILLDNAVKYTPAGGRVTVRIGAASEGRTFCQVTDTGIGIAPEHVARIFERFYRVDPARSRRLGGCGLGLAIALEIAALHDTVIAVDSQALGGASFRVTFPHHRTLDIAHAS